MVQNYAIIHSIMKYLTGSIDMPTDNNQVSFPLHTTNHIALVVFGCLK